MSASTTPLPFEQPARTHPGAQATRGQGPHAVGPGRGRGHQPRVRYAPCDEAVRFGSALPLEGSCRHDLDGMTLLAVSAISIIGEAVNDGLRTGNMEALRNWTLIFGAAATAEWFSNRQRMIMAFVGTHVVANLRLRLFRHLHALSLNFHNNVSVGRLMSRLIGDVSDTYIVIAAPLRQLRILQDGTTDNFQNRPFRTENNLQGSGYVHRVMFCQINRKPL